MDADLSPDTLKDEVNADKSAERPRCFHGPANSKRSLRWLLADTSLSEVAVGRKVVGKKSQHLKEGWRRDAKRLQDAAPGRGGKSWAMQVCAHAAWWVSGKEEEIRERTL